MSLKLWADSAWLKPHATSPQEVAALLGIVRRDLADAAGEISRDWRFGIAYNAALKLCTLLLYASGYRAGQALPDQRTIEALKFILPERAADVAYLNACRIKRHQAEYDTAGVASHADATELADFVREFEQVVVSWLRQNHPRLLPG